MNNISLYLLTVLIWGSTWIAVEFQIPASIADPNSQITGSAVAAEVSIVSRYAIASLVMFIWYWLQKLNLKFSLLDNSMRTKDIITEPYDS